MPYCLNAGQLRMGRFQNPAASISSLLSSINVSQFSPIGAWDDWLFRNCVRHKKLGGRTF